MTRVHLPATLASTSHSFALRSTSFMFVTFAALALSGTSGCSDDGGDDDLDDSSSATLSSTPADSTASSTSDSTSVTASDSNSTSDSTSSSDTNGVWGACPPGLQENAAQCITQEVPLDWDNPSGTQISVFVHKTPATATPVKGQLWLLDGGPGDNGEPLAQNSRFIFGDISAYDVFTMTHRGTGRSTLLKCEAFGSNGSDDFEDCATELQTTWNDGLLHFNTQQAAQDLGHFIDDNRVEGQSVNIYALSYGTFLAQRYLKAYPTQANLVVLDGVLDLQAEIWLNNILAEASSERLMNDFCAMNETCKAALGDNPLAAYTEYIESMRNTGVVTCAPFSDLTPADIRQLHGDLTRATGSNPELGPAFAGLTRRLMRCSPSDQVQLATFHKLYDIVQGQEHPDPSIDRQSQHSDALSANVLTNEILNQLTAWPSDEITPFDDTLVFSAKAGLRFEDMYAQWPHSPLPDDLLVQATTSVPMLLVNGGLDRQTVLPWADRAAAHFQGEFQTYAYVPVGGHGLVYNNGSPAGGPFVCLQDIFAQVLAQPLASPAMTCLEDWDTIDYEGANQATKDAAMNFFGTQDIYNDANTTVARALPNPALDARREAFARKLGQDLRNSRERYSR